MDFAEVIDVCAVVFVGRNGLKCVSIAGGTEITAKSVRIPRTDPIRRSTLWTSVCSNLHGKEDQSRVLRMPSCHCKYMHDFLFVF